MGDLTASFVPETGEMVLDGSPAGPAGEAGLVPVAGLELAFDRADGHLVRVIMDPASAAALEFVTRLFDAQAAEILCDIAGQEGDARPRAMSPDPRLCAALSNLARLDATRAASPVPASSPWWAAEAAVLSEQAGLHSRTLAEAGKASCALRSGRPHRSRPSGMDVAAEMADIRKHCLPGLHWVLDPGLAPPDVFRPGLTPYSDLRVHRDAGSDCVLVRATLARGAGRPVTGRWHARLVDPIRPSQCRVLTAAEFKLAGSTLVAGLRIPREESADAWIEVVDDPQRPVRSATVHSIQRALRWADAALRAEREPAGISPLSTGSDWAALAAVAWERCRRDWEMAGDPIRAAAVLAPRVRVPGPPCLAEVLGE